MKRKTRKVKTAEIQAVLPAGDNLANVAKEWRRQGGELLQWFAAMPEAATDRTKHVTISIPLELDIASWMTYAAAAKARKQTLAQVLTTILIEEDCGFEERGFKTEIEREEEKRREAEAK
jgi:hypothetical protein